MYSEVFSRSEQTGNRNFANFARNNGIVWARRVFRLLGASIRAMRHVHCINPMQQAEEGALLLQHKIAKYTSTLLGGISSEDEPVSKPVDDYAEQVSISFQDAFDDPAFSPAAQTFFSSQQYVAHFPPHFNLMSVFLICCCCSGGCFCF